MSKIYQQLVMWKDVTLHTSTPKEFEESEFEYSGIRIKFAEEIKTVKKYKGYKRGATLFYVHRDDLAKFVTKKYTNTYGGQSYFFREVCPKEWAKYPQEILDKYPPVWKY